MPKSYQTVKHTEMELVARTTELMVPAWMTPEQIQAVNRLYDRNPDGSTRQGFFDRVEFYDDYCGLGWCGMFIGIEKDGYTHS